MNCFRFSFILSSIRLRSPCAIIFVIIQVVAPKFKFDVAELDFGPVSFGFLQSRTLKLTNESDIPFQFALSVPMDGKYNKVNSSRPSMIFKRQKVHVND